MSAHDCLNHPWMKNNPIPSLHNSAPSASVHPTSVGRTESSPSIISSNILPPLELVKTPQEKEENPLSSQPAPGKPPLHPRSSQKSLSGLPGELTCPSTPTTPGIAPLPAITPFLNKESRMGSRQNLNRLRSMSKSREVLSERIQMSNLKKNLSKSRERLFDARIGLSTSRDDLLNCKSLSQSVEALTALSQLHQNGALYKSCNNIFIPMIHLVNKQQDVHDRMYKSLASIDKIPGNDLANKMGYFESRFSADDDYNAMITMRNTNMNIVITNDPADDSSKYTGTDDLHKYGSLRGNTCRGGRGAEGCDRVCTRHSHKQPEPQSTQKIRKISRSEKMKKDAQKRRKEKRDQENKEKEQKRKTSLSEFSSTKLEKPSAEGSTSPTIRRGSVCHVEQRLQERHERLLEKQERNERKLSLGSNTRRPSNIEFDRSPISERRRSQGKASLSVEDSRPRSITPSRRRKSSKSESSRGSDVSQASSMESVTGSLEDVQPNQKKQRRRSKISPPPSASLIKSAINREAYKANNDLNGNVIPSLLKPKFFDRQNSKDQDEAYVSLEDTSKDEYQIPCDSDDEKSTKSDSREQSVEKEKSSITPEPFSQPNQEEPVQSLKENEQSTNIFKEVTNSSISAAKAIVEERRERKRSQALADISDLSSIQEESSDSPKYARSVSTTSDLGSTISEESEDHETLNNSSSTDIESKIAEYKKRTRSHSIQPKSMNVLNSKVRNRSNSVHQPSSTVARPWGELCSGSIAKALKNFTLQDDSDEAPPSQQDINRRRQSSPLLP